jgi:hypothetical protein
MSSPLICRSGFLRESLYHTRGSGEDAKSDALRQQNG